MYYRIMTLKFSYNSVNSDSSSFAENSLYLETLLSQTSLRSRVFYFNRIPR